MASSGPNSFVSVVKLDGAVQLKGENAARPFKPGQTIATHGTFDDQTETDVGFFVVLRCFKKSHTYELAPLGCKDPYWEEHLKGAGCVSAHRRAGGHEGGGPRGDSGRGDGCMDVVVAA